MNAPAITITHTNNRTQGGLGPCPMRASWVVRVAGQRVSSGAVTERGLGAFLRTPLVRA